MITWAKLRPANFRKDDENEPIMRDDARRSLNVNEEYINALRTKSYVDFFSKAHQLLIFNELPSFCHQEFSETLLEPDQETIPTILETAILSKNMPQLKALLFNYFDISAEASNICGHLLRNITQIQYQHQFLLKTLDAIGDNYSPDDEKVKSMISKIMNSFSILNDPFSDPNNNKTDFKLIHDKYSSVLNHLKSKRKKVSRKIKMIKYFHMATGICITTACSSIAVIAILVAAHSLTAILMGPLFFSSFPRKCLKKKQLLSLFRSCFRSSGLLRKAREQLDVAAKETYILNRDFDTMGRLVARLHDEVEHNNAMIRLYLDRLREDRFSKHVVKELKKSSVGFQKQIEELEEHVCLCLVSINRARALVIKEMTKSM
ncbi:hypothetical protein QYF36_019164 [Acer negundo]|nr:hypothetical protein QYF36_019164 [Acer negundo]